MYTEYFGLRESPFSIAPDPRYLYMSGKHREALAHLVYGIQGDGFILLTGEVGTGKTTVCRCLLEQLPENTDVAFVLYPRLTVRELFATICDELGIDYPRSNAGNKDLLDGINRYLLDAHARGRKTVLIIEEAQNLTAELLEQVRLLTNLETSSRKLLQIIMVGQPELRDVLARPDMKQVAQRITARYHLEPLSREEVGSYVRHRLAVAGGSPEIFSFSSVSKVFHLSGGIPRVINLICDRSLLGAYSQGRKIVGRMTVARAWQEIKGTPGERGSFGRRLMFIVPAMVLLLCGVMFAAAYYARNAQSDVKEREVPVKEVHVHVKKVTLQWPASQPIEESEDMAYRALYGLWGTSYGGGDENACKGPLPDGLQCLRGVGSIKTLISLNRPAVLTLFDSRARKYYAALTGIEGKKAVFMLGPVTRRVDMDQVENRWFGDFTMLWRKPRNYHGDIRPGDRGPEVKWLSRQLSRILAPSVEPSEDLVYNRKMVNDVKKFQLSKGLTPDGVVGPRTVMLLSAEGGRKGPVLKDTREVK